MRTLRIIPVILFLFLVSCKKDSPGITEASAINIINATIDGGAVKIKLSADNNFLYAGADQIYPSQGKFVYAPLGQNELTIVSSADTDNVFLNSNFSLSSPINTLYLSGQLPNLDTMFREERDMPFVNKNAIVPDSVLYVRFVNVCSNSAPVNIKVGAGTEFSGLAYKGVSEFKSYSVKSTDGAIIDPSDPNRYYVFEVRGAGNTLITTFNLPIRDNRFKTISLVLQGAVGGPGATPPSVFSVIYF